MTQSGPYRYTRHPLYLGSSLIGIGMAVVANNLIVAVIVIAYLALTLTAAMRSEEAHLREKFGDAYDAYAEKRAPTDRATLQLGTRGLQPRASHDRRAAVGTAASCRENVPSDRKTLRFVPSREDAARRSAHVAIRIFGELLCQLSKLQANGFSLGATHQVGGFCSNSRTHVGVSVEGAFSQVIDRFSAQ